MAKYTQERQNLKVQTQLDTDVLLARAFSGTERISAPFEFQLDLLSEDPKIDDRALLRTEMLVTIEGLRHFRGWVRSFSQLGQEGDLTAYRAILVPSLWFLSLSSESRIYREMTVLDVVKTVFEEHGIGPFSVNCTASYEAQDFRVQYRETHFDFISRLLEEEGIFYYFRHDEQECTLVLADHRGAHRDIEPAEVSEVPVGTEGEFEEGTYSAASIVLDNRVHVKRVSLRDVDTDQSLDPVDATDESPAEDQEQYEYPAGFTKRDGDGGEDMARACVEAREMDARLLSGVCTLPAFEAGRRFKLARHYRSDVNGKYLLTSVQHRCRSGAYLAGRQPDQGEYRNSFTAIPEDVPFRPERVTPRPVIHGVHPARVTGGSGDEIHVDAQGRVKVQFFWDRQGKLDENSSCWIRVAQGWAGANRGFLQIPRVGDEVMVAFSEGDPDRPYVIGSVYNESRSTTPWDLPTEATMTGLRSLSSKGGGGFNEISLEDKSGDERVYIHAQKDMDVKVLNDQSNTVDVDRTEQVGQDNSRTVGRDDTQSVGEKQALTVGTDQEITVGADQSVEVGGSRTLDVGSDDSVTVGGNHSLSAGSEVSLSSGTDTSIGAGANLEAAANANAKLSAGAQIEVTAGAVIKLSAGSGVIEIGPAGVKITGATISLSGIIKHN